MLDIVFGLLALGCGIGVLCEIGENGGFNPTARNGLIAAIIFLCLAVCLPLMSSYKEIDVKIEQYKDKMPLGDSFLEFDSPMYSATIVLMKPYCAITTKTSYMVDPNYNNLRSRIDQFIRDHKDLSRVEWKDKTVSEKISMTMTLP